MSGCVWRSQKMWSITFGLASLMGLNLLTGVAAAGTEALTVKPSPEQDGMYLYGEASAANQLGKGYFIFQQSGQKIVGAMYYPQSEYTCFTGNRTTTNVHLQPFELGNQLQSGQSQSGQDALQVSLPQLYKIDQIGVSERQALAACQQEAIALQSSRSATAALPRR
jgi:hypothetical protein